MLQIKARHEKTQDYLDWLEEMIDLYSPEHMYYTSLIKYMFSYNFRYSVIGDECREKDATNILYIRYMDEHHYDYNFDNVYDRDVSVLEVLMALSIRIERDIMGEVGNYQDDRWFWIMIDNLGLNSCVNDDFDEEIVDYILSKWLDRRFSYDGTGSIFPIKTPRFCQKDVEIWYQMCEWIDENYPIEG